MNQFKIQKLAAALTLTGLFTFSTHAMASAFQLWEQDAASVGNYHAGYAAAAFDASTAFYNPAGLTRFKEQQVVVAADGIMTDFKYRGTVRVNSIGGGLVPLSTTAQGGNFALVGALHYVAPLSDMFAFGLSVDAPFGLKVNYGYQTPLRYASTITSVEVIDISPVLAIKLNDHVSIGAGPDAQIMKGEFDSVGTLGGGVSDSPSINAANDTGYGMHAGVMYEFTDTSRIGLSYHSQVVHHLTGTSTFSGLLADGVLRSSNARVNLTLPAYTALSGYHKINPSLAVMGSVIYTQWSVFKNLQLQNVAGFNAALERSTSVVVNVPQYFRNTVSASVGADYFITETITLRGGFGVDQSPVNDSYRNVQLPDNNHFAFALGSHIQSTPTLGFDLGWTHIFISESNVNPPAQVMGAQVVTTAGTVNGGADVLAAQVVWNMV